VGEGSRLIPASAVNFPRVYPITESNYTGKPDNILDRIVNIVKCGHLVKHRKGDRALLTKKRVMIDPIYSKKEQNILDDNGGKIVAQAKALRNGRDKLNATLFDGYRGSGNWNTPCYGSKVVIRCKSTLGTGRRMNPIEPQGTIEEKVFKRQTKLALLAQGSDKREMYKLQEKLARAYDFRYLAVQKAVGNKGGKTPGVDNIILKDEKDMEMMANKLLQLLNRPNEYKVSPVRRVYIPKASGGERPQGIPTIQDRCMQGLIKLILEPVTETTSDPNSYGFRKGRSTKNALAELRYTLRGGYESKFVLDADIKGYFDNISHE
jgi:hypothetical protein